MKIRIITLRFTEKTLRNTEEIMLSEPQCLLSVSQCDKIYVGLPQGRLIPPTGARGPSL